MSGLAPVIVERSRGQKLRELGAVLVMFGVMAFVIVRGFAGSDEPEVVPTAIPVAIAVTSTPQPVLSQLRLESTPPKTSAETSATFTYSWNDPGDTFECRLDSEPYAPCDSSGQLYVDLDEGIHIFQVRVLRVAAEPTDAISYSWTVDTTVPTVAILPPSQSFITPIRIVLEASEGADVFYTLDGSEPTDQSLEYGAPIDVSSLTTIRAIALDEAGNYSAVASAEFAFAPTFRADFQDPTLDAWSSVEGMQLETTANGTEDVARITSADGSRSYAALNLAVPITDVYVQTGFALLSQGDNPVTLTRLRSDAAGTIVSLYVASNGRLAVQLAGSTSVTSSTMVAPGDWHEVQAHISVVGTRTSIEVWFNGVYIDRLNVSTNLNSTAIESIQLGESAEGRTFDVAFDDFAIDAEFIPSSFVIFQQASPEPAAEASPAASP